MLLGRPRIVIIWRDSDPTRPPIDHDRDNARRQRTPRLILVRVWEYTLKGVQSWVRFCRQEFGEWTPKSVHSFWRGWAKVCCDIPQFYFVLLRPWAWAYPFRFAFPSFLPFFILPQEAWRKKFPTHFENFPRFLCSVWWKVLSQTAEKSVSATIHWRDRRVELDMMRYGDTQ